MTEQEAINILEVVRERTDKPTDEISEGLIITALTGAISALEKQIAEKPKKIETEGYRYTDTYRCTTCGGNFSGTGIADYCYHCGQKLDWSEI